MGAGQGSCKMLRLPEGRGAPRANGNAQYWVNGKGSTVAGREKTDMILFTRADGKPRVECASCHDPHNGPDAGVTNVFLRINNKDSDVCLSCHVK